MELNTRIAQFNGTAWFQVGLFDADFIDERSVGTLEVLNDVGAALLVNPAMITTDGVVHEGNIVFVHRAEADDGLVEDQLLHCVSPLNTQFAFPQVEGSAPIWSIGDLSRRHVVGKFFIHKTSVDLSEPDVNCTRRVDVEKRTP